VLHIRATPCLNKIESVDLRKA